MADIVLEENVSDIDETGKKKKGLNADYMGKADVLAIVSGFAGELGNAASLLDKVCYGSGFSEGYDALSRLVSTVTGGDHITFARKNSWIADSAQRSAYLTSGVDQGIADKQLVIDFYKLVTGTQSFRTGFVTLLNSCLANTLYSAYSAMRFESQMKEVATPNAVASITLAVAEFGSVYDQFNTAKIYDEVPVSKSKYSDAENIEIVLDFMDEAICKWPHLSQFLLGAKKASPSAVNQLYVFDRETKAFAEFASKADSMQRCIDTCSELNSQLMAGYAIAADGLQPYLDGYRQVLEKLITIFERALKIINDFKTQKTTAPYSIMHYDPQMTTIASNRYLCSLSDPFTEGTSYRELAQNMVQRYKELARTVAKGAPN